MVETLGEVNLLVLREVRVKHGSCVVRADELLIHFDGPPVDANANILVVLPHAGQCSGVRHRHLSRHESMK